MWGMSVYVAGLAVRGFLARCPWPMRQRGPGAGRSPGGRADERRSGAGGRREGVEGRRGASVGGSRAADVGKRRAAQLEKRGSGWGHKAACLRLGATARRAGAGRDGRRLRGGSATWICGAAVGRGGAPSRCTSPPMSSPDGLLARLAGAAPLPSFIHLFTHLPPSTHARTHARTHAFPQPVYFGLLCLIARHAARHALNRLIAAYCGLLRVMQPRP